MKIKKFTIALTAKDYLDVTIKLEKNKIKLFALNYRALIKNIWREIYRVDNYHGFLHEQKFWRTKKPIPIQEHGSTKEIINKYAEEIKSNYEKYKKYYEENEKYNQ